MTQPKKPKPPRPIRIVISAAALARIAKLSRALNRDASEIVDLCTTFFEKVWTNEPKRIPNKLLRPKRGQAITRVADILPATDLAQKGHL